PGIEVAGERHGGLPDRGPVPHVSVQPGIGNVRFRDAVGQARHDLPGARPVRHDIPGEGRLQDRRGVDGELQAAGARRGAVQVEENEPRPVAAADVVDDLVLGDLAVYGAVERETGYILFNLNGASTRARGSYGTGFI